MARLPYLDLRDAEPRVAELLGKAPDLGVFRMVANAQRAFPAWMRFGARLFDPDELDTPALGADGQLVVRFTTQVVRDATPDEATLDLDPPLAPRPSASGSLKVLRATAEQMSIAHLAGFVWPDRHHHAATAGTTDRRDPPR
jgi:hypothetical protein